MAYEIEFAESVEAHLKFVTVAERSRIFDAIERRLRDAPLVETRNRKPLRPNPVAPWELRVGALRVFYEVARDERDFVRILAIGKKARNVLRIAGQEIKL